jgi:hypothetical protein
VVPAAVIKFLKRLLVVGSGVIVRAHENMRGGIKYFLERGGE